MDVKKTDRLETVGTGVIDFYYLFTAGKKKSNSYLHRDYHYLDFTELNKSFTLMKEG